MTDAEEQLLNKRGRPIRHATHTASLTEPPDIIPVKHTVQTTPAQQYTDDDSSDDDILDKSGAGGSSCHQCKSRRNFVALTYCTSNLDKKNKKCRKKFCGHCLKKFYKESPAAIPDKSKWICASCRGICCCAACRRRKSRSNQHNTQYNTTPPTQQNTVTSTANKSNKKVKTYNTKQVAQTTPVYTTQQTTVKQLQPVQSVTQSNMSVSHSPALRSSTLYTASPAIQSLTSPSFPLDSSFLTSPTAGNLVEFDIRTDYTLNDVDNSIVYSDDESDDSDELADVGGTVPETQFYNLLGTHIRTLANDAYKNPQSTFAKLYRTTQQPAIKRKITAILTRTDLKREAKVEMIANMLMPLQTSTITV